MKKIDLKTKESNDTKRVGNGCKLILGLKTADDRYFLYQ